MLFGRKGADYDKSNRVMTEYPTRPHRPVSIDTPRRWSATITPSGWKTWFVSFTFGIMSVEGGKTVFGSRERAERKAKVWLAKRQYKSDRDHALRMDIKV